MKKFFAKKLLYAENAGPSVGKGALLRHISHENQHALIKVFGKSPIGVVTLEVKNFFSLSTADDADMGKEVMEVLEYEAVERIQSLLPSVRSWVLDRVGLSSIVFFLELERPDLISLATAAYQLQIQLREYLNFKLLRTTRGFLDVMAGYSVIDKQPAGEFPEILHKAYCQARRVANNPKVYDNLPLHVEFQRVLEERDLVMLYQPVIEFQEGEVLGWEAFVRGPESSALHDPKILFALAEEMGAVFGLEHACRQQAMASLGKLDKHQLLFLNTHPSSLNDPNFTPDRVNALLRQYSLSPDNIVMEFTERHSVKDMPLFLKTIEVFRTEGFQVCIDDVGAGHSTLRYVTQARPDFVKIDISLIGGVDANPYNRVMVETLIAMTDKIGSKLLAVGVETETELSSLVSMGAYAGQGNLLGAPQPQKEKASQSIPVRTVVDSETLNSWKCSSPIIELARPTLEVRPETPVRLIKEMLTDQPPQTSVVIVNDRKPLGLLMQYSMDRRLSSQFGMSLYYKRPVDRIMDDSPLVVDGSVAVEDVAKLAMGREPTKVYDDIVVTEDGMVAGVVSVQRMIDTMTQIQVELAKGANPLSGLPGNVAIEREIERRAGARTPSSLIYADLDNFKVYNDVFGFERGDRIILIAAEAISTAVKEFGGATDFVGHVGGDDFVAIVDPGVAGDVCAKTLELFSKETPALYRQEDIDRGYIVGKGRDGKPGRFPLVSLSLAIVDCTFVPPFNMDKLSWRVAELKKAAKAIEGNSCVREDLAPA